jgi:hypothetical protein
MIWEGTGMKTGRISAREALGSLSEDEQLEFGIRVLDEVYAIDEELRTRHGGFTGSGRHHLLADLTSYISRAEERLRQNNNIIIINEVADLVRMLTTTVSAMIRDEMRTLQGDTRKIDRRTGAKIIRPHPADHKVRFIRDGEGRGDIYDFEAIPKIDAPARDDLVSVRVEELIDVNAKTKFLHLLISKLEALGWSWSDRLSAIFAECLEQPELIGVEDGRLHFNVKAIATALKDKPQNVSNALRHLDDLSRQLGDPDFTSLIQDAVRR